MPAAVGRPPRIVVLLQPGHDLVRAPVAGSTVKMSPPRAYATRPLSRRPNGAGMLWPPAGDEREAGQQGEREEREQGDRPPRDGAASRTGWRAVSVIGSHLSRKVQRGRCRTSGGLPHDVIGVVGECAAPRSRASQVGQVAFEAVGRGSCDVPSLATADRQRLPIGAERRPQRRERPCEPRLGRAQRDAERGREPRDGHPDVVVQDEDGPLLGPQGRRNAALELVAVGDQTGSSRERRGVDRRRARPRSAGAGAGGTTSRQALTVRRWSQASNRSGSRRPGRSRQARM